MSGLYDRAARSLGWSLAETRRFLLPALRDLVRPVDPSLADEMSLVIQSGAYGGERKPTSTKIWQREDWPGPLGKPLKYSWKLVRPHVRADEVNEWLAIYRADHPGVEFVASETKPRGKKGPKIIRGPGSEY